MESALTVGVVTLMAYVATNLDNLVLLVGVSSRPRQPFASIVAGVVLASAGLLALCLAAALAADFAPQRWIGYLGVLPIAIGLRELYRSRRAAPAASGVPDTDAPAIAARWVAGLMLANSADSLAALTPLVAESRDVLLPVVGAVVLATSLAGCGIARWITTHERVGARVQQLGQKLVPYVLIAVGLYVLLDTRTDTVLS